MRPPPCQSIKLKRNPVCYIQVAIDEMQNRVKDLNHVISLDPPDMKKLQLKLGGSVSVQVIFTMN